MKNLIIHLGLLLLMIILIIINVINKNIAGLLSSIIAAILWFRLSVQDIIELNKE